MGRLRIVVTLAVLLGLGLYVYFVELPKAREDAAAKTLLRLEADEIDTLTLTYPDREIRLQQTAAGEWNITAPIETKADDTTVNNLVNTVTTEEVTRSLTPDEESGLVLYGLDAPLVLLDVTLSDGTTLPRVSVGKDTPVGFSVYVQKAGDEQLHLTRQAFRLGLTKEVKELRDKRVLPFDRDQVNRITISAPAGEVVLSKTDADEEDEAEWTFAAPAGADSEEAPAAPPFQVDDATVRTYLSTVEAVRAEDFIEEPLLDMAEFGLDPARLTLRLGFSDDETHTLYVGTERSGANGGGAQRYVKRHDGETLYLVRAGVLDDLSKTVRDFRDKTVADIEADAVHTVRVTRMDDAGFTITRGSEDTWEIDHIADGALKTARLQQFVDDLADLRGFEIVADDPEDLSIYGLQEPALTLAALKEDGETLATVLLGKATQDGTERRFAMQAGGATVYGLREYVFARFDKQPGDFWEPPEDESDTTESSTAGDETTSFQEESIKEQDL